MHEPFSTAVQSAEHFGVPDRHVLEGSKASQVWGTPCVVSQISPASRISLPQIIFFSTQVPRVSARQFAAHSGFPPGSHSRVLSKASHVFGVPMKPSHFSPLSRILFPQFSLGFSVHVFGMIDLQFAAQAGLPPYSQFFVLSNSAQVLGTPAAPSQISPESMRLLPHSGGMRSKQVPGSIVLQSALHEGFPEGSQSFVLSYALHVAGTPVG